MKSKLQEDSITQLIQELGREYGRLRKQRGFTQKEVAERSGLSIFTISTFESGHSTGITMAAYIKLLRAIGCDGLTLTAGAENKK